MGQRHGVGIAAVDGELQRDRVDRVLVHDRRLQLLAVGPAEDGGEQAFDDRPRLRREDVAVLGGRALLAISFSNARWFLSICSGVASSGSVGSDRSSCGAARGIPSPRRSWSRAPLRRPRSAGRRRAPSAAPSRATQTWPAAVVERPACTPQRTGASLLGNRRLHFALRACWNLSESITKHNWCQHARSTDVRSISHVGT